MYNIGLIPVISIFSRIWGGERYGTTGWRYKIVRLTAQFGTGAYLGYIVDPDNPVLMIASSILYYLGEKPAWTPLIDEVSRLSPQKDYLPLRMAWRGIKWTGLVSCLGFAQLYYYDTAPTYFLLLLMGVAFPLSAYTGYRWQTLMRDKHAFMEYARGADLTVLILIGLLFYV